MANIIALSTAQHLHTSYESTVRWGFLDAPHDHVLASEALKRGAVVAHGFGQFYALSTRPDASTVGQMNQWKGRPFDQVGSISTTPLLIPSLFDWSKVPDENAQSKSPNTDGRTSRLGTFWLSGPGARRYPDAPLQQRWRNSEPLKSLSRVIVVQVRRSSRPASTKLKSALSMSPQQISRTTEPVAPKSRRTGRQPRSPRISNMSTSFCHDPSRRRTGPRAPSRPPPHVHEHPLLSSGEAKSETRPYVSND